MKSKYLSFIELIFTVVAICGIFFIQGCSKSEIENLDDHSSQSSALQTGEFRVYNEKYKMPKGLAIWEAQLNKVIEMDPNMVRDGLKMIRYEYIRQIATIKDLESVKTELKNDNSLFIVYKDNSSHFSISESKEYAANYSIFLDSLIPTSESMLQLTRAKGDTSLLAKAAYIFEKNDIGVVNLVWEYKGKTLNTLCLVSNKKGIVYDKFLFFICTTVSKITSVQSNSSKMLRLYTQNDGPVRANFHVDKTCYNIFGNALFICWVDANLIGVGAIT
jgi:hypothetical protein